MTDKNSISDELLTAYIDGELSGTDYDNLSELIAGDQVLQSRVDRLQIEFADVAALFQQMRVPDLSPQVAIIKNAAAGEKNPAFWTPARMAIAAGIVVAAFSAGMIVSQIGFSSKAPPPVLVADKKIGWRQSVANYVALFTPETLNRYSSADEDVQKNLRYLSRDIDLELQPESIQLASLDFKQGRILGLRGKPLVQLVYLYNKNTPVAFCIIKGSKGKKPMQFEQRNGLEIAHWSSESHGFMVIGDLPKEELGRLAKQFSVRF